MADELGFDRFHRNIGRIFRVYYDESATRSGQTSALTPPPMAAALKKDFPDVLRATRFGAWGKRLVSAGDKSFTETRYKNADPDFFAMFTFPFVKGDPATALSEPYAVVLTEAAAAKYFGPDDPMGKTLKVDNTFDPPSERSPTGQRQRHAAAARSSARPHAVTGGAPARDRPLKRSEMLPKSLMRIRFRCQGGLTQSLQRRTFWVYTEVE